MIHTSYTINLTKGEFKALQYVMVDQQDWAQNAISTRALEASDKIINIYTNHKIQKGEAITAIGTTAIIEAAYAEGVVGIAT